MRPDHSSLSWMNGSETPYRLRKLRKYNNIFREFIPGMAEHEKDVKKSAKKAKKAQKSEE